MESNSNLLICEDEYKEYLENTVFELDNEDNRFYFLAWILDITETEVEEGKDFLLIKNLSFKVLWELLSRLETVTIVVENYYVDRVYRDSYYFYYSGKHFSYSRYCKRLSLFLGKFENDFFSYSSEELNEIFVGTIVIRPISGRSIGRTLIDPKPFLNNTSCRIRLIDYNVTVYGKRLHVSAFPFSMQDGETTSCAEITILNLLDYYSKAYPEYRYLLPSEISELIEQNSFERRIPTTGISYELISKIFCDAGFYPRLYSIQKMSSLKFKHILHYYIESGIPVALGLKLGEENKHSVVCIGHLFSDKEKIGNKLICAYDEKSKNVVWTCDTADTVDMYCIMDDNAEPYRLEKCVEDTSKNNGRFSKLKLDESAVEYMMVPLYKRMNLEASDAHGICLKILADLDVGIKNCLEQQYVLESTKGIDLQSIGTMDNPLVIRLFMTSSRTFRKIRDEHFRRLSPEVRDLYNMTVFPKFIWVCEITTESLYEQNLVLGEIIIDATSSADAKTDSSIIIHYPYTIGRRRPQDIENKVDLLFAKVSEWFPFKTFCKNLTNFDFESS